MGDAENVDAELKMGLRQVKNASNFWNLAHSFITSSDDFLGSISSIYGAKPGYVSTNLLLRARWTDDLTFDLAPADILHTPVILAQ